ncbi:hypothetical protein EVAR_19596_1 [Eumeta japonica]|uniref:Uncharacterized protein n=1 Tax=Eumeta variegata TaxID=151549 RepID=A0A4C1UFC0_EUMVA|nr:hypothetical protein EVAR_19596_1 [Eumeta japonica]
MHIHTVTLCYLFLLNYLRHILPARRPPTARRLAVRGRYSKTFLSRRSSRCADRAMYSAYDSTHLCATYFTDRTASYDELVDEIDSETPHWKRIILLLFVTHSFGRSGLSAGRVRRGRDDWLFEVNLSENGPSTG